MVGFVGLFPAGDGAEASLKANAPNGVTGLVEREVEMESYRFLASLRSTSAIF